MHPTSINLIDEINNLSRIHTLDREDISGIMHEFAKRIAPTLRIEKISVWLLNDNQTRLVSIGEFDSVKQSFKFDTILSMQDSPNYFKAILNNDILLAENVRTNKATIELAESYFIPNDIISLMDIPIRLEGALIGVICFEKTGNIERQFSKDDQVFAMSLALVLASTMEARFRRALQAKLDKELKEKEVLIQEIHHRVKNNLSVVASLIRLQSDKAKDDFHYHLLNECRSKIISIAGVHDIVYQTNNYQEIDTKEYFNRLVRYLTDIYASNERDIEIDSVNIQSFNLSLSCTVPLALIVNEVITNSFKHAFLTQTKGKITISIQKQNNLLQLDISDNGIGMQNHTKQEQLGMDIINGLVDQLDGKYTYHGTDGTHFSLTLPLKLTS